MDTAPIALESATHAELLGMLQRGQGEFNCTSAQLEPRVILSVVDRGVHCDLSTHNQERTHQKKKRKGNERKRKKEKGKKAMRNHGNP